MSAQIKGDNKRGVEIYLKNAFVLLKSVQKFNTDVDVALVVNFHLSDFFKDLFSSNNIAVYQIEFQDYLMPPDFTWSLAFFKIAALKWINSNTDYRYCLQLESDEVCISNFDDMWQELDHSLLTVFSPFRKEHPVRQKYTRAFQLIHKDYRGDVIGKTGAGFIAGSKENLTKFVEVCDEIYDGLKGNLDKVDKNIGDELYTSLYCSLHPECVKPANPYIDIYWTGNFYFVSTNYCFDAVSIIHLPGEKNAGLIVLYNYYLRKGRLPSNEYIFKLMGLPKTKAPFSLRKTLFKFSNKLKNYKLKK